LDPLCEDRKRFLRKGGGGKEGNGRTKLGEMPKTGIKHFAPVNDEKGERRVGVSGL